MKRKILLSPACRAPQLWGYAGEKDHSVLIVELSKDIADCDFCQAEITIKGNLYRTDDLGIIDSKVSFELTTAMVEESGLITAQIVGYVVDENGNILEIAKSEIYTGNIKKSSSGKLTPADSNPSLLDRILAKVHVLIEKAHTHLNKSILDRFGEDEHGGLIYAGKEISSGGVQSLTAFPETASEGDVILLHRCNEISVDDSYGGVILDLPAIASFGLPDEYKEYDYYERVWEFATINPNGTAFSLRLHSYISLDANGEECVLTNLTLVSDTVADNWYWKDGELSTEIPSASPDPLPLYIPLGNVDSFSCTKKLIKDFREYEDTDETVIFRTAPRHYAYMGGNWQLVKGSDVADGAIIGTVKSIEKDEKKFLQLGLLDSHDLRLNDEIPKNIYIPVDGIKNIEENIGGVIVNSAEIMLPTGSGGIKSVSALPDIANEGDVVYYCPPPNTLTSADIGKTIHLNLAEFDRLKADVIANPGMEYWAYVYLYGVRGEGSIGVGAYTRRNVAYVCFYYILDRNDDEISFEWVLDNESNSFSVNAESCYITKNGETTYITEPFDRFTIGDIEDAKYELVDECDTDHPWGTYSLFYTEPRFYRFTNGAWVEILTPEADTSDIWTAIDEIRDGIDEVETLIDESGVLDE